MPSWISWRVNAMGLLLCPALAMSQTHEPGRPDAIGLSLPARPPALHSSLLPSRPPRPGEAAESARHHPLQVFLSVSMGADMLRQLKALKWPKGTRWVFRGLPPGQNLNGFTREMQALGPMSGEDQPVIDIDPVAFVRYRIVKVPTRLSFGPDERPHIEMGASHPELDAHPASPKDILEPPLDSEIRRRLQAYDWQKLQGSLIEAAWSASPLSNLPIAHETRHFTKRLEIDTRNPLRGIAGHSLLSAHQRYPLWPTSAPSQRLLIVGGQTPEHWQRVVKVLKNRSEQPTLLLVTGIDPKEVKTTLAALRQTFGTTPQKLPSEYVERLGLKAIPAIIEMGGGNMSLSEIGP